MTTVQFWFSENYECFATGISGARFSPFDILYEVALFEFNSPSIQPLWCGEGACVFLGIQVETHNPQIFNL